MFFYLDIFRADSDEVETFDVVVVVVVDGVVAFIAKKNVYFSQNRFDLSDIHLPTGGGAICRRNARAQHSLNDFEKNNICFFSLFEFFLPILERYMRRY